MKSWKIEDLFKAVGTGDWPRALLLKGEEPYLERELRKLFVKQSLEIQDFTCPNSGPDAKLTDEALAGPSLFGGAKVLWCKKVPSPSSWNAQAKANWAQILMGTESSDANRLVLHVGNDKRIKWEGLELPVAVMLEIEPARRRAWLERMNKQRGGALSTAQLDFLSQQDAEPLVLDTWIELWGLGGDAWAKGALGWGTADAAGGGHGGGNPAFDWVDAVLTAQASKALRSLERALGEGSEPLQLLALLGKSVRLLAKIEAGADPGPEAPFLIDKVRRVARSQGKTLRGAVLLKTCAELDHQLKTTSLDGEGALLRLSSL